MGAPVPFRYASRSHERVVVRRFTEFPISAKQSIAGRLSRSSKSSFSEARYTPAHGHGRSLAPPFGRRPPNYRHLRDAQNVDSLPGSGANGWEFEGGTSVVGRPKDCACAPATRRERPFDLAGNPFAGG